MLIVFSLAASLLAQSPPPPQITLAQAVAQARTASPLRGSAENTAQGAAEAARLVGRVLNPIVDVRMENIGVTGRSPLPYDVFAVVSQPLELAGKRGFRVGIAGADRDVASANLKIVDWQVALRTAQLYVQALKARGLLETLTANQDGLKTLIQIMRRRVDEGYSAESDLLKFQTESARLDLDIAKAGLDLERSLTALTFVIGASTPVRAAQLVEPAPVTPPRFEAGTVAGALARHPEAVSALARVDRAQQVAALERARRVPDPIVTAGYKRTGGFTTAVGGVTFTVPLFDRNGSAAAKTAGEARAAVAEQAALTDRLTADATSLVATAQVLSERSTRAVSELLAPAETVRNAALAAFREGTTDVLRLIDAERVYGDVRRLALELRLDALAASLEARLAIGEEMLP